MKMVDTHFKSEQNLFLHLDTETILSAPLYILLEQMWKVRRFVPPTVGSEAKAKVGNRKTINKNKPFIWHTYDIWYHNHKYNNLETLKNLLDFEINELMN